MPLQLRCGVRPGLLVSPHYWRTAAPRAAQEELSGYRVLFSARFEPRLVSRQARPEGGKSMSQSAADRAINRLSNSRTEDKRDYLPAA